MRTSPLALALMLACIGGTAGAEGAGTNPKAAARSTYLVEFVEPALASFRGGDLGHGAKFAGLKATSPAVTGARRLDVDSVDSVAYRSALSDLRTARLQAAEARFGRALDPLFVYDVASNGVALELSAAEAETLASMPGVRFVEPEFVHRPMTDSGPGWINADDVWAGGGSASRGEGVVVGIIDSGINRTHPSFAPIAPLDSYSHVNPRGRVYGRCLDPLNAGECNGKLIGLYDYTICSGVHASSECNDREANDGLDPDGHGTHVASTVVGNALNFSLSLPTGSMVRRISGVAPRANVIAYKVCEVEETCRGSWLKAALDQAVADGVDVINYSIGGTASNPWSRSDSVAMLAAREAGIVVAVSAGNDGPGAATVGAPSDSPWVLSVANATHDRGIVNRVVDLSGGASAPPSGGVLIGVGSTSGYGPRPIVFDPQFPGCAQGTDLDSPPSGASNPWPAGRFNGEIVVCERGVQARVAKSNNVRLAGGGGMILVNTAADGESTVADSHSIPSSHLGYAAGQALKAWLASGTGHQGRIEGAQLRNEPSLGDVLSAGSSRGPSPTAIAVMKPDVTAPGSNILAAAGTGNGGAFLSGTSMSSPHVAGAAALLIAAKPNWSPSQVESALVTTARDSVRLQDAVTAAGPFDAGSGTIDVGKAVTAGLYFNITPTEFRNANPNTGGQPRALNRPSVVHEACFERCTVIRRVTDMAGGGSWRVEADLPSPASATITPATFTLASGQSQDVTVEFNVSDASFPGRWLDGRLRFVRTGGAAAANAEIPVALYADTGPMPSRIDIATGVESGYRDFSFAQLVALPQADFATTPLVAPVVTTRTIGQDPTRDNRYDGFASGVYFTTVTVPAATAQATRYRLTADTKSATAWDVDLFVGADLDGDGAPEEAEELCSSTGSRDVERCELDIEAGSAPRNYWVLVQNWNAGSESPIDDSTATDAITLETVLISTDDFSSDTLTVTGPGRTTSRQTFALRLAWDDPSMLPGERRIGYLRIGATRANPGQVGVIPVEIKRNTAISNAAALLDPNGVRRMRLAAGASQDRLYLDVPPNAASLTVSTSGSGEVDLYLARADAPSSPSIATAPARGLATGTSIHPGATETITLSGAALPAGRWYVTPVNPGTTAAEFDLSVSLQYATTRPTPRYGVFYNPQRSGSGVFLFPGGNGSLWGLAWYTYREDGTPTWYLGVGPAATAQQGVWRVPIQRFSWDGSAATGVDVGYGQIALTDPSHMVFSFELDGQAGSEPVVFIDGGACAQLNGVPAEITGLWYSPARSGTGHTINAYPGLESNGAYFYDALGIARWALAQSTPFGTLPMTIKQLSGTCPLCNYSGAPSLTDIGTLTRTYASSSSGTIKIDLQLKPPMSGSWNIDLPMQRLSDGLPCQ
jgi:subtilisin family serine protease